MEKAVMVKAFCYMETPVIDTGAALVSRPLLRVMIDLGWEVHVVGINHFGDVPYDKEEWPITFYDAPEGKYYNVDNARKLLEEEDFDIIFMTGDVNRCDDILGYAYQCKHRTGAAIVALIVTDLDTNLPYLAHFKDVDVLAVYSQFARDICRNREPDIPVLCTPLGYEPENFYPLEPEERREIRAKSFHIDSDETFLVTMVNRNQLRKDVVRGAYGFHLFHEKYPNSKLYMHMKREDVGGNLPGMLQYRGLETGGGAEKCEVMFTQLEYSVVKAFPVEDLNKVYNASDVCISSSMGEGWGLTTTEAMAAGTPFIGPKHTTFLEHLGENEERGYFVACGGPDLWAINYGLSEEYRPLISCTDMARALEHVYLNREEAKQKAARAREWALHHTWTPFMKQWKETLITVSNDIRVSTPA
jgi:D-inositol-3-phosphate glycosyltransferase